MSAYRVRFWFFVPLLLAGPVYAEDVGTVADVCTLAQCERGGRSFETANGVTVQSGDLFRTVDQGMLLLKFSDDTTALLRRNAELFVRQMDQIPDGFRTALDLNNGSVHVFVKPAHGGEVTIQTPVGRAKTFSTEFVVSYDAAGERMEVVGVAGNVEVTSVAECRGQTVRVGPQQQTVVESGRCPTRPRPLERTSFRQIVDDGQFIGQGQAETLIRDDPLAWLPNPPAVFKAGGPHTPEDRPGCTTPADCIKPPLVTPGGVNVQF
jgi:hypothetical protein